MGGSSLNVAWSILPPVRVVMICSICRDFLPLESFRPVPYVEACYSCEELAGAGGFQATSTQPGVAPPVVGPTKVANQPASGQIGAKTDTRDPTGTQTVPQPHPKTETRSVHRPSTSRQPAAIVKNGPLSTSQQQLRDFVRTVHRPQNNPTRSTRPLPCHSNQEIDKND